MTNELTAKQNLMPYIYYRGTCRKANDSMYIPAVMNNVESKVDCAGRLGMKSILTQVPSLNQ